MGICTDDFISEFSRISACGTTFLWFVIKNNMVRLYIWLNICGIIYLVEYMWEDIQCHYIAPFYLTWMQFIIYAQ